MNEITDQTAVFLLPTTDPTGAFNEILINSLSETMKKTHTVVCKQMTTANIADALSNIKLQEKKKITALFILGHSFPTYISFKEPTGRYSLEDIRAEDFKDLDPDGHIYLVSCNTIKFARKIASLTPHMVYAPKEKCYSEHSILLPRPNGGLDLVYYDLKSRIISAKCQRRTYPDGTRYLLEMPLSSKACFRSLENEASKGNYVALFILGIHLLNGIEVPQNCAQGFYYLYLSLTKGNTNALNWLETNDFFPENSYYLALFYLNEKKGYDYLLNSALKLYPPAIALLEKKAKENAPLALLYLGKHCQAISDPLFLDYYLKAAQLGQTEAYFSLVKIHPLPYLPWIKGKAALYIGIILQPSNPLLASYYFKEAAALNIEGAKEALTRLEIPVKLQLEQLKKKAQEGDPEALFELGQQALVECRQQDALVLLKKAAEKGSANALRAFERVSTALAKQLSQLKQSA